MGYSRKKSTAPQRKAWWKILGGGEGGGLVLTALEIQMGGVSEPKTTSYIQVFRNCFAFLNYKLSNYRPLTTSFF